MHRVDAEIENTALPSAPVLPLRYLCIAFDFASKAMFFLTGEVHTLSLASS